MKQFVVLIYGPPCSGKSATVECLMAKHSGLFRVCADRIKWFASGYAGGGYRKEVANVVLGVARSAFFQGLPLVVEANTTILKSMWPKYRELVEKHDAAFLEINLEAPFELLAARLEQRIACSMSRGNKITLKDPADLRRRYDDYLAYKKPRIPTFDSSVLSVDDVAVEIEAMVGLAPPRIADSINRIRPAESYPRHHFSRTASATMKQFVILLYGPPCSGKSATALSLMVRHNGLFRVSPDRVKWFVSGYGGGPFRKEVSQVVLDMASSALTQGFSLIVEANARILKKTWPKYKALAEQNSVAYFELNLEAPLDLLKERLARRMAKSLVSGKNHTLRDPEDLERRHKAYLAYRKDSIQTFDSSVLSLDDIAEKIEQMVGLPHAAGVDQRPVELG
jgi:predicted kinase